MDGNSHPPAVNAEWHQLLPTNNQTEEPQESPSGSAASSAPVPTGRSTAPREWVSPWLRVPAIVPAGLTTAAFMVTIIALAIVSQRHHGIAPISDTQSQPISFIAGVFDVGIGLTWTTVPVLVFSVYGLVISAIIKQAAARQPYIELREYEDHNWGAAAERSISLNYASYWVAVAPWKAFKRRHFLLMYGFSISLVISLFLNALAAHIFYATTVQLERTVHVQQSHYINALGLGARNSLVPTLDITSSTTIYGGQNIPWTTHNASIMPFSLPSSLRGTSGWNMTTTATAHAAQLDCKLLDQNHFELLEANDGSGEWYYAFSDRGCGVKQQLFATPNFEVWKYFLWVYSYDTCDLASYYARIVLVTAETVNATTGPFLKNKIGISCIPSYYNVTGTLVATGDATSPAGLTIRSFTPSDTVRMDPYPVFGYTFSRQLPQVVLDDQTTSIHANDFASLIFYAANINSSSPSLSATALLEATSSLYVSAFAIMAQKFLVQPSTESSTAPAIVQVSELRLVVVQAVAYVVVAILAAILILLALIFQYTRKHKSILYEDCPDLVGAGAILRNSELMRQMEQIDAEKCDGRVGENFREEGQSLIPRNGWRVDGWDAPGQMSLVSTLRARH